MVRIMRARAQVLSFEIEILTCALALPGFSVWVSDGLSRATPQLTLSQHGSSVTLGRFQP